jgi:hypothetical protein
MVVLMNVNPSDDQAEPQREWWWVVECSDYIRQQYPGTPRYAVVPASRLDEHRNILCKVRYSSETAATAAAVAAIAAADGGDEMLCAWEVVRWPASFLNAHPERSRYEAVPQNDIRKFWALGAKSLQSGLSHADAMDEAARRCTLPERWCVIPNDNVETNRQERYTVKLAEDLSSYERVHVRATCDSEQAAWQAIPRVKVEDDQWLERHNRKQEWQKTQLRWDNVRRISRVPLVVALALGLIWLLITVVHWFWEHPLF